MGGSEFVNSGYATQLHGCGLHNVPRPGHRCHEWGLIGNEYVVIFVEDWDVVGNRLFWRRHTIEEDVFVLAENGIWAQARLVPKYNLARVKPSLKG